MHIIKSIKSRYQTHFLNNFAKSKYADRLRQIKDISKGEDCFIIGNGPSLTSEDLEALSDLGVATFGANRVFKMFDKTKWRPTFFACEDPVIIKDIEDKINEIECEYKFIPIDLKMYKGVNINNAYYFNMDYHRNDEVDWGFYDKLDERVTCNGTVTVTSIQLAVYMGYKNIYLIGVDHNYAKMIDENGNVVEDKTVKDYFDDNYDEGIKEKLFNHHNIYNSTQGFIRTRKHYEPMGINIYNATRGGKLEVFKRVDLDSYIKERKQK